VKGRNSLECCYKYTVPHGIWSCLFYLYLIRIKLNYKLGPLAKSSAIILFICPSTYLSFYISVSAYICLSTYLSLHKPEKVCIVTHIMLTCSLMSLLQTTMAVLMVVESMIVQAVVSGSQWLYRLSFLVVNFLERKHLEPYLIILSLDFGSRH
jgi:hypothetical protein